MLIFDISMPLMLLAITIASLLLSKRVEPKFRTTFEEREFQTRDTILFIILIAVAVSIVVFIPQMALIAIFLFSYSSLLFTFSFLFSNISKRKAQLFFLLIGLAGLIAGIIALLNIYGSNLVMFYGGLAAFGLAASAFIAIIYEQLKSQTKPRWYLAILPPILFLIIFFLYMYRTVPLLTLVLLDVSGALFAVLITLYLASLFTWKITFIFAALLTVMDIILVLVTGFMVQAAEHVASLNLPVLISLPTIPLIITSKGISFLSLGLGDFFFAGTLATQTYKKYGRKIAIISAFTMTISFAIFEAGLLSTQFGAFPGTLMIIVGWLPIVGWKLISERKTKNKVKVENNASNESVENKGG